MAKLKNLAQIFQKTIKFVIPDYQRGYSWETRHRDDLWDDIDNITGSKTHYTGMFTFSIDKEDPYKYYVVDGQQRMTTLVILINEILNHIQGPINGYETREDYIKDYLYKTHSTLADNYVYKFEYETGDPSHDYFITQIFGNTKAGADIQNTLYTRNLQNAKNEFAEKLKNKSQDDLLTLLTKITTQLVFNEYIIDDDSEVYVTFETMNNRGKKLSTLELLKNRLIYLTTIYPETILPLTDAQCLRGTINDTWKAIYRLLGKNANKALGDDEFLKDHWIMYFRYDRKTSMVFKEDLLSRNFTAKKVFGKEKPLTPNDIYEYVNSLAKCIKIWYQIKCPNDNNNLPEEEKVLLTRLERVGIGSFRPMLMAAYLKKGQNILKLLDACERFRFLIKHISERRSNTADSYFYGLAQDCYKGKITIDDLIDNVNAQTNRWFDFDNFVKACVDRYKNAEGFYSWGGLRYFLYEYERALQMSNKMLCDWDIVFKHQQNQTSIEHIYPQTPSDTYWQQRFADDHLLNSLGNLLLLQLAKNIPLQNYDFDKKKTTIVDANNKIIFLGYDYGSYSEQIVSKKYKEWTPTQILQRGKDLLDFLVDHWGIDSSVLTTDNVDKILNNIQSSPTNANTANATIATPLPSLIYDDNDDEEDDEEDMLQFT